MEPYSRKPTTITRTTVATTKQAAKLTTLQIHVSVSQNRRAKIIVGKMWNDVEEEKVFLCHQLMSPAYVVIFPY